ncbi:hypothetical protein LIER_19485 [Lithospermum erythrorhizon]|uniref:Uncharacterized protein n=1 Tax=Lithospermum erythrorhizon TaxID=34254 RepID=A0AAV3QJF9_LITER
MAFHCTLPCNPFSFDKRVVLYHSVDFKGPSSSLWEMHVSRGFLKEASEFLFRRHVFLVASGGSVLSVKGLTSAKKSYPKRLTLLSLVNFPQNLSIMGYDNRCVLAILRIRSGVTGNHPGRGRSSRGGHLRVRAIRATKEGLTKKKKKRTLVKGVTLPANSEATLKDRPATSENRDKQSEDPTILRNSLPVEIEHADLHHVREYFSILSSIEVRLPLGADRIDRPLVARGEVEGPLSPGWTSVYVEDFTYSLHFPLSPFTNELLIVLNRAPSQVHPLGWLYITVFHMIYLIVRVKPNMPLLCQLFTVAHKGVLTSFSHAKGWNIFMDNKTRKVLETRWLSLWFLLKGGMDARVPKEWIHAMWADKPRALPTDDTFASLEKLKMVFKQRMH